MVTGKQCFDNTCIQVHKDQRESLLRPVRTYYSIELQCMMLLYIVVQEQAAVIAELNTKLKSVEEDLEDANKREYSYIHVYTSLCKYTDSLQY